MAKVCVTGGSGFVGRALVHYLLEHTDHQVVALSRRERRSHHQRLVWRQCDVYSMLDIEKGLDGCDYAVYLIHSMLPAAKLVQGSFKDFDLLLADNFARAAKKKELKQIVYLGGIIPEVEKLSEHLESRLEVEKALLASGVPVTALRAGVVIGPGGSSFRMMVNLVKRLPIMLCPSWTKTKSCPVKLNDVLISLNFCLGNQDTFNKNYDLGGNEAVTYLDMMSFLGEKLGRKPIMINVPLFSPGMSKLWVSIITGAPRSLVYPLVTSLKYTMLPREDRRLKIPGHEFSSYKKAIIEAIEAENLHESPNAFRYTGGTTHREVLSIQRILPPKKMSAAQVAGHYFRWLPRFFNPFIRVRTEGEYTYFGFWGLPWPLLVLQFSAERSQEDRQLFYIRGGLLAHGEGRGRLEFREVFDDRVSLAGIHEFRPTLPWYIYRYTQALLHLFTMHSFKRHLLRIRNRD